MIVPCAQCKQEWDLDDGHHILICPIALAKERADSAATIKQLQDEIIVLKRDLLCSNRYNDTRFYDYDEAKRRYEESDQYFEDQDDLHPRRY